MLIHLKKLQKTGHCQRQSIEHNFEIGKERKLINCKKTKKKKKEKAIPVSLSEMSLKKKKREKRLESKLNGNDENDLSLFGRTAGSLQHRLKQRQQCSTKAQFCENQDK